jgi:nitroreductase
MQFMLAAHDHGLGARPMIGFEPAGLAAALGAPPEWIPVMIIVVGHRGTPAPAVSPRRGVDEIVTFIGEPGVDD